MLPTKFRFIWPSSFRGEDFKKIGHSETRIACGSHVCYGSGQMSDTYKRPSIDASYQVSIHLAEGFQRHISVIQFRYLYRDNCILNTDIYI